MKNISIDLGAYNLLSAARLSARESKRNLWQRQPKTCAGLLVALSSLPVAENDVLNRLEAAQLADQSPDDPRA